MTSQKGTWITPPVSYVEPTRLSCAFCGRPIARRYWSAAPTGEPLVFCEARHADLYVSYWLPVYGPQAHRDASAQYPDEAVS